MSNDPKLDFYLENRALIEEWAKLQEPAATVLDRALLAAGRRLAEEEGFPEARIKEQRGAGQSS